MTTVSVVIATYGNSEWVTMAEERAHPSVHGADQIVVRHEPDGTRATSLNNAVAQATGDYVVMLDADDQLQDGYVDAMRSAIDKHARWGDVLFTPAVQQIRKGRPGRPFFFPECSLETGNWLVIGTVISRELFHTVGGFHEHPHGLEDWNLWARAVRAGASIVKVPGAVYRAHMNPRSKHHVLQRNRPEYMVAYEAARLDAWG